jgi:protein-S-isoprenylcysteine O-methyltransferase Ste14
VPTRQRSCGFSRGIDDQKGRSVIRPFRSGVRFAVWAEMRWNRARTRSISDWIGFAFYSVLAGITLMKMPAFGILLMPTLALELFAALSFLIREPARAAERSGRARATAYGGTLFVLIFLQTANNYFPYWVGPTGSDTGRAAGITFWMAGSLWAAYSVWYLRHAFSIEPEARRLITGGPYQAARHPVYLGYFGQYFGMWLLFPTIQFAAALLIWFLLMADRMRNEERVLARTFPEYEQYRRRVAALGF